MGSGRVACVVLAPLQGALMGLIGYLGRRVAQPQAVLLVPVGDARVRWLLRKGLGHLVGRRTAVGNSCAPTGRLDGGGLGTWGIAVLSPGLSSWSPLGTRGGLCENACMYPASGLERFPGWPPAMRGAVAVVWAFQLSASSSLQRGRSSSANFLRNASRSFTWMVT